MGELKFVYSLILYDLFPYHVFPDIRNIIDSFAEQLESGFAQSIFGAAERTG